MKKRKLKPTIWENCYDSSWKGMITNASFAHPAKYARGLIERIFDYCLERGYLKRGDCCADCFGGIGTGGITAAYRGIEWVGVELEPRFQRMAEGWDCRGVARQEWVRFQHRWQRHPKYGALCPACQSGLKYETDSGKVPHQEAHRYVGNFDLHRDRLNAIDCPQPRVIQGDSRRFHVLIGESDAIVSSPPYANTTEGNNKCGIDWDKAAPTKKTSGRHQAPGASVSQEYGQTSGQIGRLKAGEVSAVVSSPPYGTREDGSGIAKDGDTSLSSGGSKLGRSVMAIVSSPPYSEISTGAGGLNTKPAKHADQQSGRSAKAASQDTDQKYGLQPGQISRCKGGSVEAVVSSPPYSETLHHGGGPETERDKLRGGGSLAGIKNGYPESEGQIGALKPGNVDGVVSSPPWENNSEGSRKGSKMGGPEKILACSRGHGASDAAVLAQAARDEQKTYGESPGQIGKEKAESYWSAMNLVYRSCFLAIKTGGVIVLVVKDYVKNKKRVPLCDDTCRLLEHVGFTVTERIHAMLVKETRHNDLFETNGTTSKTSRKSFFRRLAEAKGSPEINYEEVVIAIRP